jgi:hypothetical protein
MSVEALGSRQDGRNRMTRGRDRMRSKRLDSREIKWCGRQSGLSRAGRWERREERSLRSGKGVLRNVESGVARRRGECGLAEAESAPPSGGEVRGGSAGVDRSQQTDLNPSPTVMPLHHRNNTRTNTYEYIHAHTSTSTSTSTAPAFGR